MGEATKVLRHFTLELNLPSCESRDGGALSSLHMDLAECLRLLMQKEAAMAPNVIKSNIDVSLESLNEAADKYFKGMYII